MLQLLQACNSHLLFYHKNGEIMAVHLLITFAKSTPEFMQTSYKSVSPQILYLTKVEHLLQKNGSGGKLPCSSNNFNNKKQHIA
jgi:hypothetical protein